MSSDIAITTVFTILIILDIVGNFIVCWIVMKNRDMRKSINYLLVNLAAADIMYAAFIAPRVLFKLMFTHPKGVTGTVFCIVFTDGNFAWVGAISSMITLVAIAIERCYAASYTLSNTEKLTIRKLKIVICISWLFSLVFNMPSFVYDEVDEKSNTCVEFMPENWLTKAYNIGWLILPVLSFVLMAGLYSKVVHTLWFKRNDDNQFTHQQKGVLRVRKRVTLMAITFSAIFGICWGTNSIVYTLKYVASYDIGQIVLIVVDTMVLFNSAVNPFVYALLSQRFKEKMKRMICCSCYSAAKVQPKSEPRGTELADRVTPSTRRPPPQDQIPMSDALFNINSLS